MASPATAPQSLLSFRSCLDGSLARIHRLIARRLRAALDVRRMPTARLAGERDPLRRRDNHPPAAPPGDRKSTRLNSSHLVISYAVFCLKKKKNIHNYTQRL